MAKKQKITVTGSVVKVEYPTIRKSLSVDVSQLGDEVKFAALIHGVKQRLGDAESGQPPTLKYAMASRIVEAFGNGSWDLESRDVDTSAIVFEAVERIKGLKKGEVAATFEKNDADEETIAGKVKEWRANAKVKAEIAKIRAERAAAAAEESDDDDEIEL